MQIIYIAGCYSNNIYDWCRKQFPDLPNLPGQKFHKLILDGFVKNSVSSVHVLSDLPVMGKYNEDILLESDAENGVNYHYLAYYHGKMSTIRKSLQYKSLVTALFNQNPDSVVICDVLRPSTVLPVQNVCKSLGIKCYGIATDIPLKRAEKGDFRTRLANLIGKRLLSGFDGYIFLTEAMNRLVNKQNKPYVIVECLVDEKMKLVPNELQNKRYPRICLYAGGIRAVYGIPQMVYGFIDANLQDVELHIYGSGDYSHELEQICKLHSNIKYFGVVPNEIVVSEEISATLLVNPRPAEGEFTKYSFPSKNMEYMVSGTPILGIKLPGIPEEYFSYMYVIEKASREEFKLQFTSLFALEKEELHRKGAEAKEFVLSQKSNCAQAQKIIQLISSYR